MVYFYIFDQLMTHGENMAENVDYTELYEAIKDDPEYCREEGKRLFFDLNSDREARAFGLSLINRALALRDAEASYLIGRLLVEGAIKNADGTDPIETGLYRLCKVAHNGFAPARVYLNKYCYQEYMDKVGTERTVPTNTPLVDFDGKRIRLKKRGILTPVDAVLSFVDGVNVLKLSANIYLPYLDDPTLDYDRFKEAVFEGIRAWAGDYTVFGGQDLKVVVELTDESRVFDTVTVVPFTEQLREMYSPYRKNILGEKGRQKFDMLINGNRSFAGVGLFKWSVRSRKLIFIQGDKSLFDDYEEIKHIAKHEFGHALGLGDLYTDVESGLGGVEKGAYKETDSYYMFDKMYNLVMCDNHGVISNNDIEMVILAFSRNAYQNYQVKKVKDKVSEALGRGN